MVLSIRLSAISFLTFATDCSLHEYNVIYVYLVLKVKDFRFVFLTMAW